MAYGDEDWQTQEIRKLVGEVADLQYRLDRYHERLEDCLDHDRQFQLKATWGAVNVAVAVGAMLAANYIAKNWLHLEGWLFGTLSGVGIVAAYIAAFAWSDKGREGDVKKLSRLPNWSERS